MKRTRLTFSVLLAATCLSMPCVTSVQAADSLSARPAALQPAPVTQTAPEAAVPPPAATPGPDEVELAALYYYAEQKQDHRVEAETARLRLKYPDFEVPHDLYLPRNARVVDEQPLWDLYQADDFAGIEAATKQMQLDNPGWMPSADFTAKLARRKQRVVMSDAFAAEDWPAVIAAAGPIDPAVETDIDLLWMLIDSDRQLSMKDAQLAVYKGILFRTGERRLADDVLVTTLQKAMLDFPTDEVTAVMTSLWTTPALVPGLDHLNDDILRRTIADFNADAARTEPLPEKDLQRLRTIAGSGQGVTDLSLLGWYFLKRQQPAEAEPMFAQALGRTRDPDLAKGLYLSQAQQGKEADAYKTAAAYAPELGSDAEFLMNALSVQFGKTDGGEIDAATVSAYSEAIVETASAAHAEILGWYAYNARQYNVAEAWFRKSWEWTQTSDRLKGLALSIQRQGKRGDLKSLRDQYAQLYPDMWKEIRVPGAVRGKERRSVPIAKPGERRKSASYHNGTFRLAAQR